MAEYVWSDYGIQSAGPFGNVSDDEVQPKMARNDQDLSTGKRAHACSDICSQVFHVKLRALVAFVNDGKQLEEDVHYVRVAEFQRKISHMHILFLFFLGTEEMS